MSRTLDLPWAIPERRSSAVCRALRHLLVRAINRWMTHRAIESLASLDDRMLADIGLRRCGIEFAVRRTTLPL